MKTIGILGGMSAASTQIYYAQLCALTREKLGGLHSPELLIRSLDFAPIELLQTAGQWAEAGRILNAHAKSLEKGGAELVLLATNTMHMVADAMMEGVTVPMLHIGDATARAIADKGLKRPALMATAFTMDHPFYADRLRAHGLAPAFPNAADRAEIHRIIYEELCREIVTEDSRQTYIAIADRLVAQGADSLILGCTEIGMLLNAENVSVPVFDTTRIHCEAAIDWALS